MTVASTPDETPRYEVVRGLLPPAVVGFLRTYSEVLIESGRFVRGEQVRGSLKVYGDPGFDAVLREVLPRVAASVGAELVPTYSFVRRYERGHELVPHTDRPACEHSVTVHLASSGPEPWPIWLRLGRGEPVSAELEPGDGLIYEGISTLHWRDPCPAEWYLQMFLHFVDAGGAHRDEVYDHRPALGTPSTSSDT